MFCKFASWSVFLVLLKIKIIKCQYMCPFRNTPPIIKFKWATVCINKTQIQQAFPFYPRIDEIFLVFYFRKPIPSTVKAGELEKIISRCQVCMKRRHWRNWNNRLLFFFILNNQLMMQNMHLFRYFSLTKQYRSMMA